MRLLKEPPRTLPPVDTPPHHPAQAVVGVFLQPDSSNHSCGPDGHFAPAHGSLLLVSPGDVLEASRKRKVVPHRRMSLKRYVLGAMPRFLTYNPRSPVLPATAAPLTRMSATSHVFIENSASKVRFLGGTNLPCQDRCRDSSFAELLSDLYMVKGPGSDPRQPLLMAHGTSISSGLALHFYVSANVGSNPAPMVTSPVTL